MPEAIHKTLNNGIKTVMKEIVTDAIREHEVTEQVRLHDAIEGVRRDVRSMRVRRRA